MCNGRGVGSSYQTNLENRCKGCLVGVARGARARWEQLGRKVIPNRHLSMTPINLT